MIADNFLYIYSIMWDSMDIICIALRKTIIRNLFCSCCFEQQITDIIFKIPFTPAESQHSIIEKRTVKLAASVLSC